MPVQSCRRIVDLLADYLEGRLPSDTRADLDAHLQRCPSCVAQLRTYQSTISLLRSLNDHDLPPELRCSLSAFLDRHSRN